MAELSVDLIWLLPSTPRQNRELVVVGDKFIKFVELFSLRVSTSKAILERVLKVFCRHGFPQVFQATTAKSSQETCGSSAGLKRLRIKDRHTVPYLPAGQLVERLNTILKQCLMADFHEQRDWDFRIPEVYSICHADLRKRYNGVGSSAHVL